MPDESNQIDRHRSKELEDAEASLPEKLLRTPTKTFETEEQSSSLEVVEGDVISDGEENVESEIDVTGGDDTLDELDDVVMPAVTNDGELVQNVGEKTPTKEVDEETDSTNAERVFSSFPCQVIPETLSRMTRTPPDGEHLQVHRNSNGRLRIYVIDHTKKFSPYSNLTHKPCTVCNRMMRSGEMHLNFPADLDRRRIWANLLGFKYKDILRSKMGPISFSIAAGPICTEHFAEECFRNHNFNKSAIEAFGVPVAISPDVKTTPSKKRVPWVCTICEFHSCSVVELQTHLLDHTEEMLKKKESVSDVSC
uniref:THAP-type domain-containing protein n=1 Tax=Caenorhabditis japonica TaxID=281687 RepID=A0A8R1DH18_CAEJA